MGCQARLLVRRQAPRRFFRIVTMRSHERTAHMELFLEDFAKRELEAWRRRFGLEAPRALLFLRSQKQAGRWEACKTSGRAMQEQAKSESSSGALCIPWKSCRKLASPDTASKPHQPVPVRLHHQVQLSSACPLGEARSAVVPRSGLSQLALLSGRDQLSLFVCVVMCLFGLGGFGADP